MSSLHSSTPSALSAEIETATSQFAPNVSSLAPLDLCDVHGTRNAGTAFEREANRSGDISAGYPAVVLDHEACGSRAESPGIGPNGDNIAYNRQEHESFTNGTRVPLSTEADFPLRGDYADQRATMYRREFSTRLRR